MASKRRKDDIAYAMTPFKLFSWPIGVWPLQVTNIYSRMRYSWGTCCAGLVMILPSLEIYLGCTDAEKNVDCLMLICCGILGLTKMIFFRIYANNLTNNYTSALNDYLTIENAEERAIMLRHSFIGRILCCFLLSTGYISCVIYALIPLLDDAENDQINVTNKIILEYPIPSTCAMEYFNAPTSMYRIFCLMDTLALIVTNTSNLGNDSLFHNITLHLCGQVKILKTKFVNFDFTNPQVYERFYALIQRHNYLIQLAKELSDTISIVMMTQLFISSILLCIIGFQFILALKVNNIVIIIKTLMAQSCFLIQLSLYSFIGDYLTSEMEEIGVSIYQSDWYNFPLKLMRKLNFIIMRTEYPVEFQAGNFIAINLSTYMNILKSSLSYLSVLRVMVEI